MRHLETKLQKPTFRRSQSGLLFIPGHLRPVHVLEGIMTSYLRYEEVFPEAPKPAREDLVKRLRSVEPLDLLQGLAKISFLASQKGYLGKQQSLEVVNTWFEPKARDRVVQLLNRGHILVTRAQLLHAMQTLLRKGGRNGKGASLKNQIQQLGPTLLMAASFAEGRELSAESAKRNLKLLLANLYRNAWFNATEEFRHRLVRYWYMLTDGYAQAVRAYPGEKYDICGKFKDVAGVEFDFHMAVAFALHMHYSRHFDKDGPVQDALVNPEDFLIGPAYFNLIREEAQEPAKGVLRSLSRTRASFAEAIQKHRPGRGYSGYDARVVCETPLFDIGNGCYFALDIQFLADRVTKGVYTRVWEALMERQEKATAGKLRQFWGRIFELYVTQILRGYYPAQGTLSKRLYFEREDKFPAGVDFIVDDGARLVFIQCTVEKVPIQKALSGNWRQLKPSLDRVLFGRQGDGKASDLIKAIRLFRAGAFKHPQVRDPAKIPILPVLLMEEGIHVFPSFAEQIRTALTKAGMEQREANRMEFWDSEELELMGQAIQTPTMSDLILQKHGAGYESKPMKNYLFATGQASYNPFLQAKLDGFFDHLTTLLFKKSTAANDSTAPAGV